eukprot:15302235-Alexandrium_andersonii.AAC.1
MARPGGFVHQCHQQLGQMLLDRDNNSDVHFLATHASCTGAELKAYRADARAAVLGTSGNFYRRLVLALETCPSKLLRLFDSPADERAGFAQHFSAGERTTCVDLFARRVREVLPSAAE